MSFDMAREMSGKSIACAIADDDAVVRPFDRTARRRPACSSQSGARLPKRDATLLLKGVGDRVMR